MDYVAVATIVFYLGGVTAVGAFMMRRTKGSVEWAVAGGGMSGALVAFALAGSRIGGAGTYGVAGAVINGGVWNMWWYGISSFAAMAFVGLFFAVYYRRLGLQTVAELFAVRFGSRRCQWLTSFCVQTENAIINVIEPYVIGVILSSLTPLTMLQGVLIAAAVFSVYVSLGGIWATAVTNVIHTVVNLVSLLAVGILGVREMGGWDAVTLQVNARLASSPDRSPAAWWGFAGAGWLPIFGMLFAAAIHSPAASVYANFSTATRSERSLAPAFIVGGMIAALMPVLAGVIGILAVARYGLDAGLAGYDNITRIASEISPVMGGVAIAAVLAAVISSGGPILLASATMLVRDWMPSSASFSSERRAQDLSCGHGVLRGARRPGGMVARDANGHVDPGLAPLRLRHGGSTCDLRRVYPLLASHDRAGGLLGYAPRVRGWRRVVPADQVGPLERASGTARIHSAT